MIFSTFRKFSKIVLFSDFSVPNKEKKCSHHLLNMDSKYLQKASTISLTEVYSKVQGIITKDIQYNN